MDSDDNKFETCKTITKEFPSTWVISVMLADEPLMTKSDDNWERAIYESMLLIVWIFTFS